MTSRLASTVSMSRRSITTTTVEPVSESTSWAPRAGQIYYRHRYYLNDRADGYDRNNGATWKIALPLTSEPDSFNTSFYAQDSWKAGAGLTINAGIRWEGQDVRNRDGETAFDLKDNWAPRVGFVWDVARNTRSKLYANWGRFYESIPMDINIRSFGGEVSCFCYNFSPNAADILQDPAAPRAQALNRRECHAGRSGR